MLNQERKHIRLGKRAWAYFGLFQFAPTKTMNEDIDSRIEALDYECLIEESKNRRKKEDDEEFDYD